MLFVRKIAILATSCAVIAVSTSAAEAQSRYGNSPVIAPQHAPYGARINRYNNQKAFKGPKKYKNLFHKLRDQKHISYQVPPPPGMFQQLSLIHI